MAGTRLSIALVFCIQVLVLTWWAVQWTGNDIIWNWWNLWWSTAAAVPTESRANLAPHDGSSIALPTWQIRTNHPDEWNELIQEYNKKNPNLYDIIVSPCCSNDDDDDDPTCNNDPVDLLDCSSISSSSDKAEPVVRAQTDGTWVLESATRETRHSMMSQWLLPSHTPCWSVSTCLQQPQPQQELQFNFVILQDDMEDNDAWNGWLYALDHARRRTRWFSSSSSTARVNVQTHSIPHSLLLLQNHQQLEDETTRTQTTTYSVSPAELMSSWQSPLDTTEDTMVVHLLVPPPSSNSRIVLSSSLEANPSPEDKTLTVATLEENNNSHLVILLPSAKEDDDDTMAIAHTVLRHMETWRARNCLGVLLPGTDQEATTLSWRTNDTNDIRTSTIIMPTWWSKLLWHRALSLELYPTAWSRAHELVARYESMTAAATVHADPWWSWLRPPDAQPLWTEASRAAQQIQSVNALATAGQFEQAVQQLLLSSSSFTSDDDDDSNKDLYSLILDYSPDQYLAMIAPLLIPMILPALVAVIREAKRFRQLTTTTARTVHP